MKGQLNIIFFLPIVTRTCESIAAILDNGVSKVRILGESDNTTVVGYAQVYRQGQWEFVCHHGWSELDARTLCYQLGYDRGAQYHIRIIEKPEMTSAVWAMELMCAGWENDLANCSTRSVPNKCQPAPVSCDRADPNLPDGEIRLIDGPTPSSGRIEVSYRGLWGAICDRYWGETNAGVVCGFLGYHQGGIPTSFSVFNFGFEVFLDAVKCSGGEKDITECMSRKFMEQNCVLGRTAGVVCVDDNYSNLTGQLQLAGSDVTSQGYLQISYYGVWGTICGRNWGDDDARVACRQLGYPMGKVSGSKDFIYPWGPIWLTDIDCIGNESSIKDCTFPSWKLYYCDTDCVKIECFDVDPVSSQEGGATSDMVTVYVVMSALGLLLMVIFVVVIIICQKRQKMSLLMRETDKMASRPSDTRNPLYLWDTSIHRAPGHSVSNTRSDVRAHDDPLRGHAISSGVYTYIKEEGNVYLEILSDDVDMAENKTNTINQDSLQTTRSHTPLPDLPSDAISNELSLRDDTYLEPICTRPKDNGYLLPLRVPNQNGQPIQRYQNIPDVLTCIDDESLSRLHFSKNAMDFEDGGYVSVSGAPPIN